MILLDWALLLTAVAGCLLMSGGNRLAVLFFCLMTAGFNIAGMFSFLQASGFNYHFGAALTDYLIILFILRYVKPTDFTVKLADACVVFIFLNGIGWLIYEFHISSQIFTFIATIIYLYVLMLTISYGVLGRVGNNANYFQHYRLLGDNHSCIGAQKTSHKEAAG